MLNLQLVALSELGLPKDALGKLFRTLKVVTVEIVPVNWTASEKIGLNNPC